MIKTYYLDWVNTVNSTGSLTLRQDKKESDLHTIFAPEIGKPTYTTAQVVLNEEH